MPTNIPRRLSIMPKGVIWTVAFAVQPIIYTAKKIARNIPKNEMIVTSPALTSQNLEIKEMPQSINWKAPNIANNKPIKPVISKIIPFLKPLMAPMTSKPIRIKSSTFKKCLLNYDCNKFLT